MDGRAGETATGKAHAMISAFASVGARSFDLTVIDLDEVIIHYRPNRSVDELRRTIGHVLNDAEHNRHNVIIRPRSTTATLIQLDDLDAKKAERITPQTFIVFQTSPANYQAWVAVKDAPVEKEAAKVFVRQLRKGIGGADKSATGSTRIAGSRNVKTKYAPNFPTVEITHTNAGNITNMAALEQAGLLATEEPNAPPRVTTRNFHPRNDIARGWPNYQQALSKAPLKSDGKRDRSMADFMWCIWAIDRERSIEETAEKLLEVSEKAQENARRGDKGYASVTTRNAADAVEKRGGPRPIKSTPSPPK
jgi:hypothetical protein